MSQVGHLQEDFRPFRLIGRVHSDAGRASYPGRVQRSKTLLTPNDRSRRDRRLNQAAPRQAKAINNKDRGCLQVHWSTTAFRFWSAVAFRSFQAGSNQLA